MIKWNKIASTIAVFGGLIAALRDDEVQVLFFMMISIVTAIWYLKEGK